MTFLSATRANSSTCVKRLPRCLRILLASIASISLVVGGIGIMNIMLVTVTERTREIGIRKALGATRLNILIQFLVEAMVLCLIGGLVGVLLGVGISYVMNEVVGWQTFVSPLAIGIAFAFSAGIGLFFRNLAGT